MTSDDWLYSPERMKLRESVLNILLSKYGGLLNDDGTPKYSPESIYACAHDWVSQGPPTSMGVVAYSEGYYK